MAATKRKVLNVPTDLVYLDAPDLYESTGTVTKVTPNFEGGITAVLDKTIFYPQGGGQPTDKGVISTESGEFQVSRVSFVDGDVLHNGRFSAGQISPGDVARLTIDEELRKHHARLHTGGHLVMTAVDRLLGYPATKGYHFPDGPYVEFGGNIPAEKRDSTVGEIQSLLDVLVAENSDVTWEFESVDALRAKDVHIPAEIPAGKPTRVVLTAGYYSPCGGTHVRRLGLLDGLKCRSVKVKSGKTRVSYSID